MSKNKKEQLTKTTDPQDYLLIAQDYQTTAHN